MQFIHLFSSLMVAVLVLATIAGIIRPELFKKPLKARATQKFIIITGVVSTLAFSGLAGATRPDTKHTASTNETSKTASADSKDDADVLEAKTEKKTETLKQEIEFPFEQQRDPSLAAGTTKVLKPGVKGEKSITYEVTYEDGRETGRTIKSETVIKKPEAQVIAVGTQTSASSQSSSQTQNITNGSSTDDGDSIADDVIGDPVAECNDGTISTIQKHEGACDKHGGVKNSNR